MNIHISDFDSPQSLRRVRDLINEILAEREAQGPAPLVLPETTTTITPPPTQQVAVPVVTKRARRTKAEIEAAKAEADAKVVKLLGPLPDPVAEADKRFGQPHYGHTAEQPPAPVVEPPAPSASFLDDDEPVAKQLTKDDVRAALVGLQLKRQGQYEAEGVATAEAAVTAQEAVKALMHRVGGSGLGTLDPSKFQAVIDAANAEAAK